MTRVQSPDKDDWNKLDLCIHYLNTTLEMTLSLNTDGTTVNKWWVDASYATHPDCRSHTGALMMMGKGVICSYSLKQKINTHSSTEDELVGVDDMVAQVL